MVQLVGPGIQLHGIMVHVRKEKIDLIWILETFEYIHTCK